MSCNSLQDARFQIEDLRPQTSDRATADESRDAASISLIQTVGCASNRTPQGCSRKAQGASPGMSGMRTGSALKGEAGPTRSTHLDGMRVGVCDVVRIFIGRLLRPCMINVVTQLFKGKIPVVGSFSLLLSLCECLWKCAKTWDVEQKLPQKNTGGRKRSPFELRARPEGRSSARTPGSSRTGPCPRRSRTYRCKGERLGCGITLGGLP